MNPITEWQLAWQHLLPPGCVDDLLRRMHDDAAGYQPPVVVGGPAGSESRQQSLVRLDAAQHGVWLTRNNVGAFETDTGQWVRYGLANESKQQNVNVKSADLIGIRKRLIVPADVGTYIGQFVSREVKEEGWSLNPRDKHQAAQVRWRDFVISQGGDASFASGPGSFNYARSET